MSNPCHLCGESEYMTPCAGQEYFALYCDKMVCKQCRMNGGCGDFDCGARVIVQDKPGGFTVHDDAEIKVTAWTSFDVTNDKPEPKNPWWKFWGKG